MICTERFRLDDSFILGNCNRSVAWGPVGYLTYKRTYARPLDSCSARYVNLAALGGITGATEEWWLTVARVVEGCYSWQKNHCTSLRLPWSDAKAQRSAQRMYELIFTFKFLPPGRGLFHMGSEYTYERGGAALNNCAFVTTDNIDHNFSEPFEFMMDMSMLGVGVGFDTKGSSCVAIKQPTEVQDAHFVTDTREGWVEVLRRILNAYVGLDTLPRCFDYSNVRPAGKPIRGFGGLSSGPEPLRVMVENLNKVLRSATGKRITSTNIVDLMNIIGDCVVSGNVRRSAQIALGNPTDNEFLTLKQGVYPSWRGRSNNTVVIRKGRDIDYRTLATHSAINGEPGYFFIDNARDYSLMDGVPDGRDSRVAGCNPCVEQSLEDHELCCLVETCPSLHDYVTDYKETLKYAYMYAKTVTLVPTHNSKTNAVMMRNRRIGTSQTGVVQAINKFGFSKYIKEICSGGYTTVGYYDRLYSDWLCVPRSIKTTSIKPSGSVSLLPGVTAGMHWPCSEYYFKVMRFNPLDSSLDALRAAGYRCVDLPTEGAVGVYIPVQMHNIDRGRGDVTIWEQLELAATLQRYWADNQVSATVTVRPHEVDELPRALEMYSTRLKGVSFLPFSGHGYEHAPEQPIDKETYEAYIKELKPLDLSGTAHEEDAAGCDGDSCLVK